jgi:hypothetical protein
VIVMWIKDLKVGLLYLFLLSLFYRLVTDIPEARDIRFGG